MFSPVSPDGPPARAYAVMRRTRRRGGAGRVRAPAGRLLRQRGDELIPDRYVRRGLASWYGDAFDGKPTASGEPFDSTQFTTAHYDLPFDSRVRVRNLNNDREVELRVNDRVPLEALNNGRLLDVSAAAARPLEMVEPDQKSCQRDKAGFVPDWRGVSGRSGIKISDRRIGP